MAEDRGVFTEDLTVSMTAVIVCAGSLGIRVDGSLFHCHDTI